MKKNSCVWIWIISCFVVNHIQGFDTISVNDLMALNLGIEYIKCDEQMFFNFGPFPLSVWPELQPSAGMLASTFIMTIPRGKVYSYGHTILGLIMVGDQLVEEMIWPSKQRFLARHPDFMMGALPACTQMNGKVAVIAQEGKAYAHWMLETLGRLALLEMYGVDFDYLYVPCDAPFKKETLRLWGIDESRIIEPFGQMQYVAADELIVPSLVGRKIPALDEKPLFCMYLQPSILEFVRHKFLSLSEVQLDSNYRLFSKKVFISRKDAKKRRMINEDMLFELLEAEGFGRYNLSELSVVEQIILFKNADIVVAAHGSGLTNILFCCPGTKIVEIFQSRGDCMFWYLSQMLGLQHHCIKTSDFSLQNGASNTYIKREAMNEILRFCISNQ